MAGRCLVQGRIVLQDGCSWLRNCIAIQFIVLQEEADLARIVLQNLYCRRLGCREFVSQYKNCIVRCSGKRQGCLCRKTGSCVATRRWAQQVRAWALWAREGRAGQAAAGAGLAAGAWARRKLARAGRAGAGRASARQRHAGRAAWALGAWAGLTGWPRAMHSVHSACFWPGLTQFCS